MNCARWLLVILLLAHTTALAQAEPSPIAKQQAAERFERGVQLFKEQAYRAAVIEFQRAYDLVPDYRLLYNLAHAKHQLQDYLGAARDYEAYLAQGGAEIPSERRAHVEQTLSALGSRVGRIDVKVNRAGVEVYLDDARVGAAPLPSLLLANIGRHRVSARAPDGTVAAEFVDVAGGDIAEVRVVLSDPAKPIAAGAAARHVEPARPWSPKQRLAVASLIAGGAGLIGGITTGVMSLRAKNDLDGQIRELGVDRGEVDDQRDKVDRLSMTTDVMIGAGIALAATGTVLWLVGTREQERTARRATRSRIGIDVGVRAVSLTGRF